MGNRSAYLLFIVLTGIVFSGFFGKVGQGPVSKRPNILFAIADDQSFAHVSALGGGTYRTPAFDEVVARGAWFTHAFAAAPQCSPSRAALLTGRSIWQLEEAGTHSSYFPRKFPVFTEALQQSGYHVGFTGKPWGPGNFEAAGWKQNPVGEAFNRHEIVVRPTEGISRNDYATNFADFLSRKDDQQPFFFWYGGMEPHRLYETGSGARAGFKLSGPDAVPGFLPDVEEVRSDLLDYALEIEWFDKHLGSMLRLLEERGELENTIVVVTADNGMAFPHAKANLYEYGIHVPLAVCGPNVEGRGRRVSDLVSLADLCPTFLEAAQVALFDGIAAKSLWPLLKSSQSGKLDDGRAFVLAGRERHTHARPSNVGYPARAIRTDEYLYIRNFLPDRWPVGDPPPGNRQTISNRSDLKPIREGYEDVDDSPSKSVMIRNQKENADAFDRTFGKRASEELYHIHSDPYCLENLASRPSMRATKQNLETLLIAELKKQNDPRVIGGGEVFDSYPRFGSMRPFEGFKEKGAYNPEFVPRK
jgi:N-sulfoglucosamine sulfohydrolase